MSDLKEQKKFTLWQLERNEKKVKEQYARKEITESQKDASLAAIRKQIHKVRAE